MLPVSAAYSRY